LTTLFKVVPILLYNTLLETLQLLSEIFLSVVLGFRDIWLARVV